MPTCIRWEESPARSTRNRSPKAYVLLTMVPEVWCLLDQLLNFGVLSSLLSSKAVVESRLLLYSSTLSFLSKFSRLIGEKGTSSSSLTISVPLPSSTNSTACQEGFCSVKSYKYLVTRVPMRWSEVLIFKIAQAAESSSLQTRLGCKDRQYYIAAPCQDRVVMPARLFNQL